MLVVELATLFVPTVSLIRLPNASRNCTEAVFVKEVVPASTVALIVARAPAGIAPRLQVNTAPVCVHMPWEVVEDWKVPGSVSVRVTSVAFPGPLLVTVMAKVTKAPALSLAGEVIVIARSAPVGAMSVTALDGADSTLFPVALVAWTVNVYVVPLLRPVKFTPVWLAGTIIVRPPGLAVTV